MPVMPLQLLGFKRVGVETVLVGLVILVLIAAGVYYLRRRMTRSDDSNEETGVERAAERDRMGTYSVPLRSRVAGMPREARYMTVLAAVIMLIIAWNVYDYLKTGSPTQMAYTIEAQMAVVGGMTFAAGILYERRRGRREGQLSIHHEARPEDGRSETWTETVYFNADDTEDTDDGLLVYEYKRNRMFGLFRTPKRVAEDRVLRGSEEVKRPLDDKIAHLVPEHAREVASNHYSFHTKGKQESKSAKTPADYIYKSSWSLSSEQYIKLEHDQEKLETDYRETKATLAHKNRRIRQLERMVENSMTDSWEQFIDIAERLAPLFGSGLSNKEILNRLPKDAFATHSKRDGLGDGDASGNGVLSGGGGS